MVDQEIRSTEVAPESAVLIAPEETREPREEPTTPEVAEAAR